MLDDKVKKSLLKYGVLKIMINNTLDLEKVVAMGRRLFGVVLCF
jgi:hypothetical protein